MNPKLYVPHRCLLGQTLDRAKNRLRLRKGDQSFYLCPRECLEVFCLHFKHFRQRLRQRCPRATVASAPAALLTRVDPLIAHAQPKIARRRSQRRYASHTNNFTWYGSIIPQYLRRKHQTRNSTQSKLESYSPLPACSPLRFWEGSSKVDYLIKTYIEE